MYAFIREVVGGIIALAAIIAILFGVSMLSGCMSAKIVYDACRDGHCR